MQMWRLNDRMVAVLGGNYDNLVLLVWIRRLWLQGDTGAMGAGTGGGPHIPLSLEET